MPYTTRQKQRIRESVDEYQERQRFGPRRGTWAGLCDEIFDETGEKVRDEVLRQWVKRFIQKGRKEPLTPNDGELDAIVKFLMLPKIDVLSPDELKDPEPPRFLYSFVEFLHGERPIDISHAALNGAYEAWHLEETGDDEEKWIKTNIVLEVDHKQSFIRATENLEIHFRGGPETDVIGGGRPSEGWGVLAPDGNIFLFMRTRPFPGNYYYLTMGVNPQLSAKSKVYQLALLRHERPAKCDLTTKSLEELIKETEGRTAVLHFNRVTALSTGVGE
jgi:hypothetical protein